VIFYFLKNLLLMKDGNSVVLYVVVADDDLEDHDLVKSAIKECDRNYMVTSVYNGEQLMDLLLKRGFYAIDYPHTPDLIILDLRMPVMDGFEVLKEMKKYPELENIPVYVLTDNNNPNDHQKVKELGVVDYFTKPLDYESLKTLIGNVCQMSHSGNKRSQKS
jgi:CheY-like chemotaxis protein